MENNLLLPNSHLSELTGGINCAEAVYIKHLSS